MEVVNIKDTEQTNKYKQKLNYEIAKLQARKKELEKLEEEQRIKEKLALTEKARVLKSDYKDLPDTSRFRNEEELLDLILIEKSLKQFYLKNYTFIKDFKIGWLYKYFDDRAFYFQFKNKTADISLMIEFINNAQLLYFQESKKIPNLNKYFQSYKADEIFMVEHNKQKWLRVWWD